MSINLDQESTGAGQSEIHPLANAVTAMAQELQLKALAKSVARSPRAGRLKALELVPDVATEIKLSRWVVL